MKSTPRVLGECLGLRKMIKKCFLDGMSKREPEDLERRAAKLIGEASVSKGPQVALISQNRSVAYNMLNALLGQNVNVAGILLRDEEIFRYDHVRSYTNPGYMQRTMQSMESEGIEYFIVMALKDTIPEPVVQKFHGKLWNIHASLLPRYQGVGNPIMEQLRRGDKYGGVTVQYVGEERDSGDFLVRCKVPLIYDGQPYPLKNPSRKLVNKNYREVIFPTAAKVCAFALQNIYEIQPIPLENLRCMKAALGKMSYIPKK